MTGILDLLPQMPAQQGQNNSLADILALIPPDQHHAFLQQSGILDHDLRQRMIDSGRKSGNVEDLTHDWRRPWWQFNVLMNNIGIPLPGSRPRGGGMS